MKLLYKTELAPFLSQSKEEVIAYAKRLVESHNATYYQMANELSHLMRRSHRHEEAVEIARMMFDDAPSVDRLNLYFVAVVDYGDIVSIRKLNDLTDDFLKKNNLPYQKHLFATWLKAANKILDDNMFQYVYSQVPVTEKNSNTYIISQFYVYKNRHSQYEDVCKHYDQLPPHIQNSTFVQRYYQNARTRLGYANEGASPVATPVDTSSTDVHFEKDAEKQIFIVYGGNPVNLSVIESLLKVSNIPFINLANEVKTGRTIIEAFEERASKTDFAIVLCTPENEGKDGIWYARQNVIFECGYFMAWLGRDNVCLLCQKDGKDLELPSDFGSVYQIYLDKGSWVNELSSALKSAGFAVAF